MAIFFSVYTYIYIYIIISHSCKSSLRYSSEMRKTWHFLFSISEKIFQIPHLWCCSFLLNLAKSNTMPWKRNNNNSNGSKKTTRIEVCLNCDARPDLLWIIKSHWPVIDIDMQAIKWPGKYFIPPRYLCELWKSGALNSPVSIIY